MSELRYFLYFIPGLRAGSGAKDEIAARIPSLQDRELVVKNVGAGPGQSGDGVLVASLPNGLERAPGEVERDLEYCPDPARQVWLAADGYWCGYWVGRMPDAEGLMRSPMVGGYVVETEAGTWVVPLARHLDGRTNLDERIVFSPDGEISMAPIARYERLCGFAQEHFQFLSGVDDPLGVDTKAGLQRLADASVEALAVNYHVGRVELSLLGILTKVRVELICGLLVDLPGLLKLLEEKKKQVESTVDRLSSTCGGAGA